MARNGPDRCRNRSADDPGNRTARQFFCAGRVAQGTAVSAARAPSDFLSGNFQRSSDCPGAAPSARLAPHIRPEPNIGAEGTATGGVRTVSPEFGSVEDHHPSASDPRQVESGGGVLRIRIEEVLLRRNSLAAKSPGDRPRGGSASLRRNHFPCHLNLPPRSTQDLSAWLSLEI